MGIDYAGHCHGARSTEYRNAVRAADMLLARYVPLWTREGYQVAITSDHGMNADTTHNGNTREERCVPVWSIANGQGQGVPHDQGEWFTWCCRALEI